MSWNRTQQRRKILNKRYKVLQAAHRMLLAGVWPDDRGILKEYSYNKKSVRVEGNRKIRRKSIDYIPPRGHHKKLYDYKWTIL